MAILKRIAANGTMHALVLCWARTVMHMDLSGRTLLAAVSDMANDY